MKFWYFLKAAFAAYRNSTPVHAGFGAHHGVLVIVDTTIAPEFFKAVRAGWKPTATVEMQPPPNQVTK